MYVSPVVNHRLLPIQSKQLCVAHRNNLTAWLNGDGLIQAVAAQTITRSSLCIRLARSFSSHGSTTERHRGRLGWSGRYRDRQRAVGCDVWDCEPKWSSSYTITKSPSDYRPRLAEGGDGVET